MKILFAIVTISMLSLNGATKVEINFEKGKVYKYRVSYENDMTMDVSVDFLQHAWYRTEFLYEIITQKVEKENYHIEATCKEIEFQVESPFMNVHYNSAINSDENEFYVNYPFMVDKKVKFILNKQAELIAFDSVKIKQFTKNGLSNSDLDIKLLLDYYSLIFPKKKIKTGDIWHNQIASDDIILSGSFKVEKMAGNYAYLSCKGTASPNYENLLDFFPIELTGTMDGTFVINIDNGGLVKARFKNKLNKSGAAGGNDVVDISIDLIP